MEISVTKLNGKEGFEARFIDQPLLMIDPHATTAETPEAAVLRLWVEAFRNSASLKQIGIDLGIGKTSGVTCYGYTPLTNTSRTARGDPWRDLAGELVPEGKPTAGPQPSDEVNDVIDVRIGKIDYRIKRYLLSAGSVGYALVKMSPLP
jgi:hypothetical protein